MVKTLKKTVKKTEKKEATPKVEAAPKAKTTHKKVACEVIMATPTYFVINKNGEQVTVEKANNYRRGQYILY